MVAYLACGIVFVDVPFLAGVWLSVLIHGTESVRDGALPWTLAFRAGTFLAGVGVITEGCMYFFVDYLPELTAAFILAFGLLLFLPMVKRHDIKRLEP